MLNFKLATLKKHFEREHWTLARVLTITVSIFILTSSGIVGYYALKLLADNKREDVWAIMYLELERRGTTLSNSLQQDAKINTPGSGDIKLKRPLFLFVSNGNTLEPVDGFRIDTTQMFLKRLKIRPMITAWTLWQIAGDTYLVHTAESNEVSDYTGKINDQNKYLAVWKVNLAGKIVPKAQIPFTDSSFMLANRFGDLLFSTDSNLTEKDFAESPLLGEFIQSTLRSGQVEYSDGEGTAMFGFFYDIPELGVVMFSQTPKEKALKAVYQVTQRFLLVLFFTLLIAVICLQLFLQSLIGPLKLLTSLAQYVSEGRFDITAQKIGFGEVSTMGRHFFSMAEHLRKRDESIMILMEEQKKKSRLEGELAVARTIQSDFLPHHRIPAEAKLEVVAIYQPTVETAGDWYGYYFDENTKETVVAIADVSGHGMGSAMFTVVIAGIFEQMRAQAAGKFDPNEFIQRVNQTLLALGHQRWHASIQVARLPADSEILQICGAGHPAPLLCATSTQDAKTQYIRLSSELAGLGPTVRTASAEVAFPTGSVLIMYTDGFVEARTSTGERFGGKRLATLCNTASRTKKNQDAKYLHEEWTNYLKGTAPDDDVCILSIRRSA